MLEDKQKNLIRQDKAKENKAMRRNIICWILVIALASISGASFSGSDAEALCKNPKFTCMRVQKGQTWQSLFPDPQIRTMVMKLNRVNIQARPGSIIVVPNNLLNITHLELSPFARQIPAPGEKLLIFDPKIHAWAAYDAMGRLVNWGPGAGGRDWCPDIGSACHTKTGQFYVYNKGGAGCISNKFPIPDGGAPMPYCMFFHGGYAFHGSDTVPGFNASHGCVRLFNEDAEWLSHNFVEAPNKANGYKGTKVIIYPYSVSQMKEASLDRSYENSPIHYSYSTQWPTQ